MLRRIASFVTEFLCTEIDESRALPVSRLCTRFTSTTFSLSCPVVIEHGLSLLTFDEDVRLVHIFGNKRRLLFYFGFRCCVQSFLGSL